MRAVDAHAVHEEVTKNAHHTRVRVSELDLVARLRPLCPIEHATREVEGVSDCRRAAAFLLKCTALGSATGRPRRHAALDVFRILGTGGTAEVEITLLRCELYVVGPSVRRIQGDVQPTSNLAVGQACCPQL